MMICHSVLGPGIRRTPVHVRPGYYWGLGSPSLRFGMRCLACFAIVCCAVIQDALLAAEDFPGRSLENRPGHVANLVSLRSLVFLRSVVDHLAWKVRWDPSAEGDSFAVGGVVTQTLRSKSVAAPKHSTVESTR